MIDYMEDVGTLAVNIMEFVEASFEAKGCELSLKQSDTIFDAICIVAEDFCLNDYKHHN